MSLDLLSLLVCLLPNAMLSPLDFGCVEMPLTSPVPACGAGTSGIYNSTYELLREQYIDINTLEVGLLHKHEG